MRGFASASAAPRWPRPQVEENLYESVDVAGVGGAAGAMGAVGGVGVGRGGAAYWWWRVAPPCRRHRRASQTLEFNERLAPARRAEPQGAAPRAPAAGRLLCGAVRVQLSASCGTIDAPPPRLLLLQRWRAPPASRSYHLLPESHRLPPRAHFRGGERACCEADEDEAEEDGACGAEARSASPSDSDSDSEPPRPD
ncbi:unnamed protein product [Euphydryas editha]|uniref:Uncharacterized protein n=1 Tax=Euphydryas editha TaxID=104508 RepID=A0AAU9U3J1_EUPED|nr:unnamed protein product [Euphydryas editha]